MYNFLAPDSILRSPNHAYTIRSVLGSGGFGITYRATMQITSGTGMPVMAVVAIKEHFLSNDCERDSTTQSVSYSQPARDRVERSRRDFAGEAKRLQAIASGHPNIVHVSEVFDANNTSYYVMEYLEGESLADYVKRHGPLSEQEAVCIMRPIIDAVSFLHRNRITHLDIKPANIMLSKDAEGKARPVLIDFGLSKHYNADGTATSTINLQGYSDGYAPVEQYVGISTFSPASDVYSLAATILFCLTGVTPPKSIELTPDALSRHIPSTTSRRMGLLLEQCLRMAMADRPADASVMLAALPRYMNDPVRPIANRPAAHQPAYQAPKTTPISTPAPEPPRTAPQQPRTPAVEEYEEFEEEEEKPNRKWLWILIATLVVLGASAAYYFIAGRHSGDDPGAIAFPSSYTFTTANPNNPDNSTLTHRLILVTPEEVIWAMDVDGTPCPVAFGSYNEQDKKVTFSSKETRNNNLALFTTSGDISFILTPDDNELNVKYKGIDNEYISLFGLDNDGMTFQKDDGAIIPQSTLSGTIWKSDDGIYRYDTPTSYTYFENGKPHTKGYILYNGHIGHTSGDNLVDEFVTGPFDAHGMNLKRSSINNSGGKMPAFTLSPAGKTSASGAPPIDFTSQDIPDVIVIEDDAAESAPRSMNEIEDDYSSSDGNDRYDVKDVLDQKTFSTTVLVEEQHQKQSPSNDDNTIFSSVEQDPSFPGGQAALLQWVSQHIQYPPVAAENGIQGRVTVQFVVTKTGSIGQVKVVRGKDPDLDREAIRVVKSLPKFTPGKMNGHPVNVWYTLPITFRLQGI